MKIKGQTRRETEFNIAVLQDTITRHFDAADAAAMRGDELEAQGRGRMGETAERLLEEQFQILEAFGLVA